MTFKFYLRDASAKTETPIMLFVRAGKSEKGHRTTIKVPTGLKILPKNWNPKTHSPRRISDESLINKRLNDIASVANKTWTTLVSEQVEISLTTFQTILKENLKDLIIPGTIQKVNSGLFDDMNKFIDILHSDHSTSTIAKYKNFRRHLMEFSDKLTYKDINLSFYDAIKMHWLENTNENENLSNTTINKNIKLLKTFMQWASDRNMTANDEFKRFKPMPQHEPTIIALSKDEFERILTLKIMNIHLAQVRDVFCFACLTGQRWSDISCIEKEQIKNGAWSITQEKTKKKVKVPLLPDAIKILKRYEHLHKPLPIISSQKTNEHLKDIGKLAELNDVITIEVRRGNKTYRTKKTKSDLLTTHVARKSFITISLSLGMNVTDVMAITGHSTYAAMKPYILITDEQKQKALNNAWVKKITPKLINHE